jgi:hypothetical protein
MLAAYAGSGFLTMSGQPAARATIAVVVTPQISPAGGSLDHLLVALAQDLAAKGSATAVAGSSTGFGSGSPVAALRASSAASQVSTIDNADFVTGQTTVIQALATQLSGGKPGSYGTDGNGPLVVTPGPAATPTAGKLAQPRPLCPISRACGSSPTAHSVLQQEGARGRSLHPDLAA